MKIFFTVHKNDTNYILFNNSLKQKLETVTQRITAQIPNYDNLVGNECADKIASDFGEGKEVELFEGPAAEYLHDVSDVSYDEEEAEKRSEARKRQNAQAHSYVSMVDGYIKTHKTWAECEDRVRGVNGAKYRKALSEEEEREIIEEFEKLV